jgi:hypothetical protein
LSRHDRQRLEDIRASIDAIAAHLQRGDLSDGLIFDTVRVRLIEIGEAVTLVAAMAAAQIFRSALVAESMAIRQVSLLIRPRSFSAALPREMREPRALTRASTLACAPLISAPECSSAARARNG